MNTIAKIASLPYKSFACQFDPLTCIRLTNDKYDNIEAVINSNKAYWMHFEQPSKNLQQQLIKKLNIPKIACTILFSEEARSRCVRFENTYILVVQGIELSTISSYQEVPSLRFWITPQGLLSISTAKLQAVQDVQAALETFPDLDPMLCLITLLEYVISYMEEVTYHLDEELNKIETGLELTDRITVSIMNIRQEIVRLRRNVLPQRDAITLLSNKVEASPSVENSLKELNNSMIRQAETLEMLRERAIIIQDNLTNQIGEISNRRMYLLTVIMLIFTPSFFIMSLFSMYLPIPGMNSAWTWWIIVIFIIVSGIGMAYVLKKKKWL